MKRLPFVVSGVLGVGAMLAVSAPAWAHVVVSPEQVTAGDYETLTVSVPTEKEVPTTKIRVEVPEGFLLSGVQPVPGWEHTFQEDGGVVRAVTFSGGRYARESSSSSSCRLKPPRKQASTRGRRSRPTRTAASWSGPAPPIPRSPPL